MQSQHLLRLFHGGLPDVFRLFETLHGNITQLLGYRRHVLVHERKGPFAMNMDCIESLVQNRESQLDCIESLVNMD